MLLSGTLTAADAVIRKHVDILMGNLHSQTRGLTPPQVKYAVTELIASLKANYESVWTLCSTQEAYAAPVAALLRSLLDSAISCLAFCKDPNTRGKLFRDFVSVLEWKFLIKQREHIGCMFTPDTEEVVASLNERILAAEHRLRKTGTPLLIVETKRPSAELPDAPWLRKGRLKGSLAELLADGLRGGPLPEKWQGWIDDLKDYVSSVRDQTSAVPERVIMTNGSWLVIFSDPADAFLGQETVNASRILVYRDENEIAERAGEVFLSLEYNQVRGRVGWIRPSQLGYRIQPESVDLAMWGLRVHYEVVTNICRPRPHISIVPAVFLRCSTGTWVEVAWRDDDYLLQDDPARLAQHLRDVADAAARLMSAVERELGGNLEVRSVRDHYASQDFGEFVNVRRLHDDHYLIVTGRKPHYLRSKPTVAKCPYHDADRCVAEEILCESDAIREATTEPPRSFFSSNSAHHCAHGIVLVRKRELVTEADRGRCGPRSGRDGEPFCEIYPLEAYLCCRTCVFEEVCTTSDLFCLPCERT